MILLYSLLESLGFHYSLIDEHISFAVHLNQPPPPLEVLVPHIM